MARRLIMLEKKLQELESELADVFRLPLDQTAVEHMHVQFDDIKERFRFLDKLRAAEANSDSYQLLDVDERIVRLKAAFSHWNHSRNHDEDDNDALSICSDCNLQEALLLEDFSGKKLSEKEEKEAPVPVVRSGIGKYCGAFGCGMIVGMVLGLFYAHYLITYEAFLIPPT